MMRYDTNKFQPMVSNLFENSCYAASLSYIFDEESRDDGIRIAQNILCGVDDGYIDIDGYVRNPIGYINWVLDFDRLIRCVTKEKIGSLMDLPDSSLFAVEYANGNMSHFVVCRRGEVIWDPYGNSRTVANGKPISYRLFN